MKNDGAGLNQILDTALSLASKNSWENLRLFDIAQQLEIGLQDIHRYCREKNDLTKAFFDRADDAMLSRSKQVEIVHLRTSKRLHALLMSWFEVLQQHRSVAKQMLWAQLEPGHFHSQISGILRVSRTVQWWCEAAQRSTSGFQRLIEETVLTTIFLMTLMYWCSDDSKDAINTSQFLENRLDQASCLSTCGKQSL
ncbi:hypothetical protein [Legionella jordanis]|uniref:TetR family transporter regulatory protein n=1 Tax=Legionella jordanis TaxID=456 RepID=A0A0W0VA31_9GAMM|nr:hypothetical protein [Legionella jordanis]KTD17003.1 TetR family transporter regulatory protein [Legionella jordanis]RMX03143.1 TetR/AcrR family transcriptional regulator [Legionella jordanis]RMX18718.1 TetR/AcrR family transcriptional regulator [Legionella jordanis]VEH12802.1 bacterial regulatory protein [Legionella jordanis]HAT8713054.1 TetR/AcrR family transcriptional regulator [Legionella jordanis]